MRIVYVFLFLFLSGKLTSGYAQPASLLHKNIVFNQLPEKLGLSQSTINCMVQDRDGFIWIGTWSGLIRYDGYSSRIFQAENSPGKIKSNKILTIYEDRNGYLWIGTHRGGLFKYDKRNDTFTKFEFSETNATGLSNNNVWSLLEDQLGNLWVGTENGLNVFDPSTETFKKFFHQPDNSNSLTQNFITDLFLDSKHNLWVSTEYGLNKVVFVDYSYQFTQYVFNEDKDSKHLHNYIYQVGELKYNNQSSIWYTTKKGLKTIVNGVIENYQVPNKPLSYSFNRAMLVVEGRFPFIVVGSETGISFFDPINKKFNKSLDENEIKTNISHNTVTALMLDRGGVFWVGTKKGLNKYDSYSRNFEAYSTLLFDQTKSIITGIADAGNGKYWISTIGGGLFKFDGKNFIRYRFAKRSENDFTDFIQTLLVDKTGNVWLGTAGSGVIRFHENENKVSQLITRYDQYFTQSKQALSDDYVMSLEEDNQGAIWVGTWSGGLNRITAGREVIQIAESALKKNPLVVMHADFAGVLWVGTRGDGLYKLKPTNSSIEVKHFSQQSDEATSLNNNFVNAIYEDHAGILWIGTEGGLNSFDRRVEKFSQQAGKNATVNRSIVSILEDESGKLWLAHWEGLMVIDPVDDKYYKYYDSHDRIMGGFFYNNVCLKDQSGLLLFGGADGFNRIDASVTNENPTHPKVIIKDFQLFGKTILFGEPVDDRIILDSSLLVTESIQLHYDQNSIGFEFAALDYAAPEKIQYAYMLQGFDEDWKYTDATKRYANYTNLDHGHYTFLVKSSNSDGVWNDNLTSLQIEISPPWWKTIWAFFGYVIIGGLVLYGFRMLVLMRVNLVHDIKLERVQRENMEKLNKAKLQFFTNISHEFRTPLTLIIGPAQHLLDLGEGGKFLREQLVNINTNAQRLLRLVNQLLDFRKVESGNLKLEVSEGNLVQFVKEIKLSFDALADQMNIKFECEASSNIIPLWFDRDQFEKILFNLLSNAFKHTPEGKSITIKIVEQEAEVVLVIEDTGHGIKLEHFDNIFQSFFSYDESRHHTGTGIGLALTRSLVDMHHGTIEVESEEGVFARFTIRLKKGKDHFDASEILKEVDNPEDIKQYPPIDEITTQDNLNSPQPIPSLKSLAKLLVVEDNHEVRAYLKSIFRNEYIVLEATNGKEGLDLALEETPDLIISDVMMPLMDGIELCRTLKSTLRTSHIPVILLTARTSLIFKVEGLETGADDYMTKPFTPKVLQLKVKNFLRSRAVLKKTFTDNEVLTIEPKRITLTSSDEKFITKALESLEENMSNPAYSVEDLGRYIGMSRMQLYRKLKALTGQSPNEFIRTIRLKRAAQLLEQKQLTVAEVTYEVGFNDLQYFRECFKKQFGVTPSEYTQRSIEHPEE